MRLGAEYVASYRKTVTLTQALGSEHAAETAVPEEMVQAILARGRKHESVWHAHGFTWACGTT